MRLQAKLQGCQPKLTSQGREIRARLATSGAGERDRRYSAGVGRS